MLARDGDDWIIIQSRDASPDELSAAVDYLVSGIRLAEAGRCARGTCPFVHCREVAAQLLVSAS